MNYNNIEGWFNWEPIYDEFVDKSNSNTIIVEIGSWLGKSTAYLASKIKQSNKKITFYTVDTFLGSPNEKGLLEVVRFNGGSILNKFKQNMKDCNCLEYVIPIESDSESASQKFENESVDFIFVDGGHTYKDVLLDLQSWFPKLKNNGIIAGHDWWHDPVKEAVRDYFGKNITKADIKLDNSVWYYQK